jgi:hypothetical protein
MDTISINRQIIRRLNIVFEQCQLIYAIAKLNIIIVPSFSRRPHAANIAAKYHPVEYRLISAARAD